MSFISSKLHLLNNFARGITQTSIKSNEPFTSHGLIGTNVVIGLSDTGVDEGSCYFVDHENGYIPRTTIDNKHVYPNQRKIIQYVNYSASNGDYVSGHGTHVAGTLLGNCYDTSSSKKEYNGIAMNAKLAFFDIGSLDGSLIIPDDITDIFKSSDPYHSQANSRIHSNSWGGGSWYDTMCIDVDRYLYEFPDNLLVFAGGNSGGYGKHSIVSPGLSKNVLTVGATETGHDSQSIDNIAFFSSNGPGSDGR